MTMPRSRTAGLLVSSSSRTLTAPSRALLSLSALLFLPVLAGCRVDLPATSPEVASLVSLTPNHGDTGQDQPITLVGEGFLPRVTQDLGAPDGVRVDATFSARLGDTDLSDVLFVDGEHLTAVVPAGLPAGTHSLVVTTPFAEELTLADAYVATAFPAPVVVSVSPPDVVNDADTPVTVSGSNFLSDDVVVELIAADSTAIALAADVTDESELVVEIPAGFAIGSYALRVSHEGLLGQLANAVTVHETAALVVTVTPAAAIVPRGEPFTVAVVVQNEGGSAALDVTVAAPVIAGAGSATLASGPVPASADLDADGEATFTFSYDATGAGDISITASAAGVNEHSARAVTSEVSVTDVTIEETATPAQLSGTFNVPATVTTSQTVTVSLDVGNTGESAALSVLPDEPTVTTTGGASATLLSSPVAEDIAGLASATFTWSYEIGAVPGTLSFATSAEGSDEHTGATTSTGIVTAAAPVVVQSPPALSGTLTLPAVLSAGQTVEVTLLLENTGEATAADVLPAALSPSVTGDVTTTLVSAPVAAAVPPGAPVAFVWQYALGAGLGTVSFAGDAAGTDANSGAAVVSQPFVSNTADVEEGAVLLSAVTAPPLAAAGSNFNVVVAVQNTGGADALLVAPQSVPEPSVQGLVSYLSGPVPSSSTVAGGGGTATFTYTYAAEAVGALTLSVVAAGSDENSGAVVTSALAVSGTVDVQPPPALAAVLSAPSPVSEGQTFTVTMTLSNNGGLDLSDVAPSALEQSPAGSATLVSAPAAPFPTLLANGGQAELTWTYVAGAAGTFTFSGTASGTDLNAAVVSSPLAESNAVLVEVPPSFDLVWTTPATVTQGQTFEVSLEVQNLGEALSQATAPGVLVVGGATGSTCGAADPASQDLDGGALGTFTWICTAGATSGAATFFTSVSGSDANSSEVVTSAPSSSADVLVQSPAALSLAWTLPPGDVSYGQAFSVTLVVANAGEAAATTTAGAITVGGTTGTSCGGPVPAAAAVPGNDSISYDYACTAGGTSGAATFSASVSGSEDNTGDDVTAGAIESAPVVVESPASLSAVWQALPARVAFAEAFTAELIVSNDGEAPALGVAPADFVVNGSGSTCAAPSPASATIAPAAQQTFRYSCSGAAPSGSALLSASASGSDENSGLTVAAASVDSAPLLVGSVAALDLVAVNADDAIVYRGQRAVPVTVSVRNLGEARADVVSAADWLVFSAGGLDVSVEYTALPDAANATVIDGGATVTFAFAVDLDAAATLGAVILDAAVTGSDALDGSVTTDAGATTTDTWTVAINERPFACFVSDFSAREVGQPFAVDATCSDDTESPASLSVEWDWESDGTFDTAPSTTRTAAHAFGSDGVYAITVRVTDVVGAQSYASFTVAAAAAGRLRLVTNTSATGAGSFTEAVAAANATVGADTIAFDRAVFDGSPTTIALGNAQSPVLLIDSATRIVGHEGVRITATRGFGLQGDDNVLGYLEISGAIQNNSHCVDVQAGSTGNRLFGNRVESCDLTGVSLASTGNTVGPGNVFAGGYDGLVAVRLAASSNDVVGNTFTSCLGACVDMLAGTTANRALRNLMFNIVGDGIAVRGTNHDVHHNTLDTIGASAVDVLQGTGHSVRNNIFTNVAGGAICDATADLDADYNDLFGVAPVVCEAAPGANNLSADPLYTNAGAGDFTLAAGSPCLDVGDPGVAVDVNGASPALYDGAGPDLGAFER